MFALGTHTLALRTPHATAPPTLPSGFCWGGWLSPWTDFSGSPGGRSRRPTAPPGLPDPGLRNCLHGKSCHLKAACLPQLKVYPSLPCTLTQEAPPLGVHLCDACQAALRDVEAKSVAGLEGWKPTAQRAEGKAHVCLLALSGGRQLRKGGGGESQDQACPDSAASTEKGRKGDWGILAPLAALESPRSESGQKAPLILQGPMAQGQIGL